MKEHTKESRGNDFSAFLPVGLVFLVLGLPTGNFAFIGVGLFFLIAALSEEKQGSSENPTRQETKTS